MNPLAQTIRERRTAKGWTLARLAEAAGCSKAYLSIIENSRHPNPPSATLLDALERALDLPPGRLRRLAEWQTTPDAVKADYARLAAQLQAIAGRRSDGAINLDALYQSGALRLRVESAAGNIEPITGAAAAAQRVPLINRVAAGYPSDFTDLDYPVNVADEYIQAPGLADPQAFSARVVGESMLPRYREGDVVVFSPAKAAGDGADCFVRLLPDHATTFKRVFFEPGDRVRLQPLNPAFEPVTVALDQVSGLYPAVLLMQRLDVPL